MRFNSKFKKQYDRPRKEFYPKATGLEVIVRNNDVEVGRIVESPSSESATLESDLFEISLGIPPTPNYSEN